MSECTGTVKWYDPSRAFGFISIVAGGSGDIFVHKSDLGDGRAELVEGQEVRFGRREGRRGPEAYDVVVVKESNLPPRPRAFPRPSNPRQKDRSRPCPTKLPQGPILATVVAKDPDNKFMFVRAEQEGFDIYVNGSVFRSNAYQIDRGDAVRVIIESSDRGPRAVSLEMA